MDARGSQESCCNCVSGVTKTQTAYIGWVQKLDSGPWTGLLLTQTHNVIIHPQMLSPVFPNNNPFFLRMIEGNIRMCQGCRSSLCKIGGTVPNPPFDVAVTRFERRSFRDKNGELRTPTREQAVHYH